MASGSRSVSASRTATVRRPGSGVSGNAILHALGQHLDPETHAAVSASHGVFVRGQFGTFPEEHSQSGIRPYLGSGLPDVEAYDDLFLQRVGSHSRYGFGELRLKPLGEQYQESEK